MKCCKNVLYLQKKISMHLSRYEKLIDLSKCLKIMQYHYMHFFSGIMRVMRSELNYAILHQPIIP